MTYRSPAPRSEPPRTLVVRPYVRGRIALGAGAVVTGAAALLAASVGAHAVAPLLVAGAIVAVGGAQLALTRVEVTIDGDVVTLTWRSPLGRSRTRRVSRRDVVAVELQTPPPVEHAANEPHLPPPGTPRLPPTRIVVRLATGDALPFTSFFTSALAANQRAVHDIEQLLGA